MKGYKFSHDEFLKVGQLVAKKPPLLALDVVPLEGE
jgi:hypothetical protein